MQPHAEASREDIAHDVRRAVHKVPAGTRALAQRFDQLWQRQALRLANAIASATAWMTPAHMIWFVALAAWPAPLGPKCVTVRPMAWSVGSALANAGSVRRP